MKWNVNETFLADDPAFLCWSSRRRHACCVHGLIQMNEEAAFCHTGLKLVWLSHGPGLPSPVTWTFPSSSCSLFWSEESFWKYELTGWRRQLFYSVVLLYFIFQPAVVALSVLLLSSTPVSERERHPAPSLILDGFDGRVLFCTKSCFLVTLHPPNKDCVPPGDFSSFLSFLPVASFMSRSKWQKSRKCCSVAVFSTGIQDRLESFQFCATRSGWQQLLFWKYQSDLISVTLVDQGIISIYFIFKSILMRF